MALNDLIENINDLSIALDGPYSNGLSSEARELYFEFYGYIPNFYCKHEPAGFVDPAQ